jgi:hypothetical protein
MANKPETNPAPKFVTVTSEKTNYSQIGYQLSISCTEAERDSLAALGLTIISQRSPAATADKKLGYAKHDPKAERADWEKAHGSKWQRNSVVYSAANAEAFKAILKDELTNAKAKPFTMNVTDVQVFQGSTEGAMAEAVRAIKLQQTLGKPAVQMLAKALGFPYDDSTDLGPDNAEFVAHVAASLKQQKNS